MNLSPFRKSRRNLCPALLLACALALPTPAHAVMDDMFSVMFRMMLVMMNVMSDAMLDNNNSSNNNWGNNFGGLNSFNMGMGAMPAMSAFGSPWNTFGTPWSSFGNPWNSGGSPWGGTPWNSFGSPWGGTPWNSGGSPWSNAWNNPYTDGYGPQYGGYDHPANWGNPGYGYDIPPPGAAVSLLDGRWIGNSGEILEIRGNRFTLRTRGAGIGGMLEIRNNILNLYSPQTNTATRYTFMRNQSELVLKNGNTLLTFRMHPSDRSLHRF